MTWQFGERESRSVALHIKVSPNAKQTACKQKRLDAKWCAEGLSCCQANKKHHLCSSNDAYTLFHDVYSFSKSFDTCVMLIHNHFDIKTFPVLYWHLWFQRQKYFICQCKFSVCVCLLSQHTTTNTNIRLHVLEDYLHKSNGILLWQHTTIHTSMLFFLLL